VQHFPKFKGWSPNFIKKPTGKTSYFARFLEEIGYLLERLIFFDHDGIGDGTMRWNLSSGGNPSKIMQAIILWKGSPVANRSRYIISFWRVILVNIWVVV
jgi:hypothetical protein